MPTAQYVALANTTLASAASSVTFSSISGAYKDLMLVINAKHDSGNSGLKFRFNSDTGSNYSAVTIEGNGSSASYGYYDGGDYLSLNSNYNNINTDGGVYVLNIMDYVATNKHKAALCRGNSAGQETAATMGRWASTAALTSILCYLNAGSYATGSTFALYGVK